MQIALRTQFQTTPDTPYVQKLLSEITTSAKMTLNDNGAETTIVTRKGIDPKATDGTKEYGFFWAGCRPSDAGTVWQVKHIIPDVKDELVAGNAPYDIRSEKQ